MYYYGLWRERKEITFYTISTQNNRSKCCPAADSPVVAFEGWLS